MASSDHCPAQSNIIQPFIILGRRACPTNNFIHKTATFFCYQFCSIFFCDFVYFCCKHVRSLPASAGVPYDVDIIIIIIIIIIMIINIIIIIVIIII